MLSLKEYWLSPALSFSLWSKRLLLILVFSANIVDAFSQDNITPMSSEKNYIHKTNIPPIEWLYDIDREKFDSMLVDELWSHPNISHRNTYPGNNLIDYIDISVPWKGIYRFSVQYESKKDLNSKVSIDIDWAESPEEMKKLLLSLYGNIDNLGYNDKENRYSFFTGIGMWFFKEVRSYEF